MEFKTFDYTRMKSELSPLKKAIVDLTKLSAEAERIRGVLAGIEAEIQTALTISRLPRPDLSDEKFQEGHFRLWQGILPEKDAKRPEREAGAAKPTGTLENLLQRFGKGKNPKAK